MEVCSRKGKVLERHFALLQGVWKLPLLVEEDSCSRAWKGGRNAWVTTGLGVLRFVAKVVKCEALVRQGLS